MVGARTSLENHTRYNTHATTLRVGQELSVDDSRRVSATQWLTIQTTLFWGFVD